MKNEPVRKDTDSPGAGVPAAAVALILVGSYFLLRNVLGWEIDNWWALFILIPALFALGNGWQFYQADRRFSPRVTSSLTGGAFMLLVAFVFLLGLSWGTIWPVFLIIGGLGMLVSTTRR